MQPCPFRVSLVTHASSTTMALHKGLLSAFVSALFLSIAHSFECDVRALELEAFRTLARAFRANPEGVFEKMEKLPEVARLLQIDNQTFFDILHEVSGDPDLADLSMQE
jgi:hypothetical protein